MKKVIYNYLVSTRKAIHIIAFILICACTACIAHPTKRAKNTLTKAFLMHMTHYDPEWCLPGAKENEEKFDLETAMAVLDAMEQVGMNMLIVDIEDGVKYASHPELTRHYSVDMDELVTLANAARERGIEFVPKLNFSKSGRNLHDKWLSPHWDLRNYIKFRDEYFEAAFNVINEIIEKCGPVNYFHIGMDEDHHRSVRQYANDIILLHDSLAAKNVKTVIWNDGCYRNRDAIAEVHADKSIAAAPKLPKDIIHILWDYSTVHKGLIKELTDLEFDVWVAPGDNKKNIKAWYEVMRKEGGSGFLTTDWIKCCESNKKELVHKIKNTKALFPE